MNCDSFFVLNSPRRRVAKKRSGSLRPVLHNNNHLEVVSQSSRPNSWSGVFQKLKPRRSAPPPPPPNKTSQLYSEISKPPLFNRADTGEYELADDVDNQWIYENPGGECKQVFEVMDIMYNDNKKYIS